MFVSVGGASFAPIPVGIMSSDLVTKLEAHFERYQAARPMHPALVEIAQDDSMATADLFRVALEDVRKTWKASQSQPPEGLPGAILTPSWASPDHVNFPLLILQQRVEEETLQTALHLLQEREPASRILAAQVLRELPGLEDAPQPHSEEVLQRLQEAAQVEAEEEVLAWLLAAIGWQRLPDSTEFLLRYVGHSALAIRLIVADNLLMGGSTPEDVTPAWQEGVMTLLRDPDEDVQWSMLYEVAARPKLMAAHRQEIEREIRPRVEDFSQDLREQAEELFSAFAGLDQEA